ncbi:MAG TPA: serine hydrolase domain-containing protein, partial [Thermoanaerobaculia bacterium]|nr:serine hydrolase domain-containing protein [Thermoanaerobaculia bacterium]
MKKDPRIDDFLRHEIDVGSFPGAVYAIGSSKGLELESALGHAVAVPFRVPATLSTIFDCASLTKPLITATLVLQAVAEGRIRLDDEFEGFQYRRLLTHTSGLAAWLPLYASGDYLRTILEQGPEYEPGTKVVYSDLNFILLHFALTRIYGDYVSRAGETIFRRLGLDDALFHPPASLRPRIAATEWGNQYEYGMCASRSVIFKGFRNGLIWGETHDGNSHHFGGTAGNAG